MLQYSMVRGAWHVAQCLEKNWWVVNLIGTYTIAHEISCTNITKNLKVVFKYDKLYVWNTNICFYVKKIMFEKLEGNFRIWQIKISRVSWYLHRNKRFNQWFLQARNVVSYMSTQSLISINESISLNRCDLSCQHVTPGYKRDKTSQRCTLIECFDVVFILGRWA